MSPDELARRRREFDAQKRSRADPRKRGVSQAPAHGVRRGRSPTCFNSTKGLRLMDGSYGKYCVIFDDVEVGVGNSHREFRLNRDKTRIGKDCTIGRMSTLKETFALATSSPYKAAVTLLAAYSSKTLFFRARVVTRMTSKLARRPSIPFVETGARILHGARLAVAAYCAQEQQWVRTRWWEPVPLSQRMSPIELSSSEIQRASLAECRTGSHLSFRVRWSECRRLEFA